MLELGMLQCLNMCQNGHYPASRVLTKNDLRCCYVFVLYQIVLAAILVYYGK